MSWFIHRAYYREVFNVQKIEQCQCCAEEVFFGFVEPETTLDCEAQMSFNF